MTYSVHCEWEPTTDGKGWWNARVPSIPGVWTQARRLEQIPGRIVEAIRVMTGETVNEADVEIDRNKIAGHPVVRKALTVHRNRLKVQALASKVQDDTTVVIKSLTAAKFSKRDIGFLVGTSASTASARAKATRTR
ncbi:MAG TPA: hypothetical protein VGL78_18035 [Solirubrobacteraceae bacterium]|jgi:predicted RNase H-like HicB family nuclease|nr:hypothetical protein [Sporichthyaceae bacterium]